MHLHGTEEAVGKRSVLQHSIFREKIRYKLKGLHLFSDKSLLNNKNIKNQFNKELGSIRKTETNHERTKLSKKQETNLRAAVWPCTSEHARASNNCPGSNESMCARVGILQGVLHSMME